MSDFIGEIRLGSELKVREYKDGTDFIINKVGVTLTRDQVHKLGRWLLGEDEDVTTTPGEEAAEAPRSLRDALSRFKEDDRDNA